ncbi:hypothetical protein ACGFXC_00745 [Streptomyces sp. NPDC048507]|uniref:hypothetical protein n=1 Tax=Streptomyces sp. NPDC048507 TaxID=3365560 RepID=UPI00371953AA
MITPETPEDLVRMAARNNAEWCAAVSRSGTFSASVWSSARRTPPLHPDAVTLTPGATAAEVVGGIDTRCPGCAVKDSFAALDLAPAGFEVLFEARWIHRAAGPAGAADTGLRWSAVRTAGELGAWAAAWSGGADPGPFHAGLLGGDLVFLAGRRGERIVAGAVASAGGGVVGVSNLFGAAGADAGDGADAGAVWAAVLDAVADRWPGRPVVGYERGEDLEAAVRAGFAPIGPLRVWLRTG